jgi:hypothetical protein
VTQSLMDRWVKRGNDGFSRDEIFVLTQSA